MSPALNNIPESTLILFLALCDPSCEKVPGDISDESWRHISELSKLHGLTPFLFYRTRSLGINLPEEIKKEWLGIYLYSLAQDQKARRQIKELEEILEPAGIPFILLKGASAMLRLYPEPGLRTFVDLDILIPIDRVPQFKKAMTTAGYKPSPEMNSPEDEELYKFDGHLDPLQKEGEFAIEPHLSVLSGRGNQLIATLEIWKENEEAPADGIKVNHLGSEHFVIHALVHCVKHIMGSGLIETKWFIDVLCAIKQFRINWKRLMDISRKWGVEQEILPIIASLNKYWHTEILLPGEVVPLDLQTVISGIENWRKKSHANLPTGYIDRLMKFRNLPDPISQVRYLFRLFFPTQENLRWRYNLSSKWSTLPYYFVHIIYTSKKFFTGLWYQILFHPKTT